MCRGRTDGPPGLGPAGRGRKKKNPERRKCTRGHGKAFERRGKRKKTNKKNQNSPSSKGAESGAMTDGEGWGGGESQEKYAEKKREEDIQKNPEVKRTQRQRQKLKPCPNKTTTKNLCRTLSLGQTSYLDRRALLLLAALLSHDRCTSNRGEMRRQERQAIKTGLTLTRRGRWPVSNAAGDRERQKGGSRGREPSGSPMGNGVF